MWQIKPPSISQNYDAVQLKSLTHKDHAEENLQLQKQKNKNNMTKIHKFNFIHNPMFQINFLTIRELCPAL